MEHKLKFLEHCLDDVDESDINVIHVNSFNDELIRNIFTLFHSHLMRNEFYCCVKIEDFSIQLEESLNKILNSRDLKLVRDVNNKDIFYVFINISTAMVDYNTLYKTPMQIFRRKE